MWFCIFKFRTACSRAAEQEMKRVQQIPESSTCGNQICMLPFSSSITRYISIIASCYLFIFSPSPFPSQSSGDTINCKRKKAESWGGNNMWCHAGVFFPLSSPSRGKKKRKGKKVASVLLGSRDARVKTGIFIFILAQGSCICIIHLSSPSRLSVCFPLCYLFLFFFPLLLIPSLSSCFCSSLCCADTRTPATLFSLVT